MADDSTRDRVVLLAALVAIAGGAVILLLALDRQLFTWSTESDYVALFLEEARRIQRGDPLHLTFHPPFYPLVLAVLQPLVSGWLATGLLVSLVSALAVLVTSYLLFAKLGGACAGLGAVIALVSSSVFLRYSAHATSDVFALALYTLCLLLVATAMQRGAVTWALSGVFLGLAVLTRTNNLALLFLLAAPWLGRWDLRIRARYFGVFIGSFGAVLLMWIVSAGLTGSPLWTRGTIVNLAIPYFAPPGASAGDTIPLMQEQFDSLWDVLIYDPLRILLVYTNNLVRAVPRFFTANELVLFPISALAVPGLILFAFAIRGSFHRVYLVLTLFHVLLVGLTTYEARYYLFLIPLFGAGAGVVLVLLLGTLEAWWSRVPVLTVLACYVLLGSHKAFLRAEHNLHRADAELGEAVPSVRTAVQPGSLIVATRSHIPFYAEGEKIFFPNVERIADLYGTMASHAVERPVYLYYGEQEELWRPRVADLRFPENSPPWLRPVVWSAKPGMWVLYRFAPAGGSDSRS